MADPDKVKLEMAEVHLRQANTLLLEVFEGMEGWSGDDANEHEIVGHIQKARGSVARALMRLEPS